jgi:uncharacterized repeat protein (TIGR03803 family)
MSPSSKPKESEKGNVMNNRLRDQFCARRLSAIATTLLLMFIPTLACVQSLNAQTFRVLYQFNGMPDGAFPQGGLISDGVGNFYGLTQNGGIVGNVDCSQGCGTVFKFNLQTNLETVLYSFTGNPDGAFPTGSLARDSAGNLYGTTTGGGANSIGTVFKLDATGTETVLHSFSGGATDGAVPQAGGVILDSASDVYGTTVSGGGLGCGGSGCGTIFKIDAQTGAETVLYSFAGEPDGELPSGVLLRDAVGNLYGTTSSGGTWGQGTVFKLDATGKEHVVHNFTGTPDGRVPDAGLIGDGKGGFYSVTNLGGAFGEGTVFEIDRNTETILHSFAGGDGSMPQGSLVKDPSGNLYGTTFQGGAFLAGTVFELDTAGTETILHNFSGPDGANPSGNLVRARNGNLYGSASAGDVGRGVVFVVTP